MHVGILVENLQCVAVLARSGVAFDNQQGDGTDGPGSDDHVHEHVEYGKPLLDAISRGKITISDLRCVGVKRIDRTYSDLFYVLEWNRCFSLL